MKSPPNQHMQPTHQSSLRLKKSYLDTCVISGLAKEDIAQEEQKALLNILKEQKSGDLKLVTSDLTKRELENIPYEYRQKHEVIYNLVADVPIAKNQQHSGRKSSGGKKNPANICSKCTVYQMSK